MMRAAVALLAASAVMAQTQGGTIAGLVRDAGTKAPIAGVRVGGQDGATTDDFGRFSISNMEPGLHRIDAEYERRAAYASVNVLLEPGKNLTGVEINLALGGTISGRVTDTEGQPVAGAAVILLDRSYHLGDLVYTPVTAEITGENGEYRLDPVSSGRGYLLLAKKVLRIAGPDDTTEGRQQILLPAYYPQARYVEDATPVALAPSEDRAHVDIRLARAAGYCISGSVHAPEGVKVSLTLTELLAGLRGSTPKPASVVTGSEGRFLACGLHPGGYRLYAEGSDVRPRIGDESEIEIKDRDIADLKLVLQPAAPLAGESVWDPEPRVKSEGRIGISFGRPWNGDTYADEKRPASSMSGYLGRADRIAVPGSFTISGIPPDDYDLRVSGLPQGCYVKQATYGGVSVLDRFRRRSAPADARLHLVFACDAGTLSARVTDRDGNLASNVFLYVMPQSASTAAAMAGALRRANVEKGWAGIAGPLPPGKYLAIASDLRVDGYADTIQKLWGARSKAKEIEIAPNGNAQVTLELVHMAGL